MKRKILSHETLGLAFKDVIALLGVRDALVTGVIKYSRSKCVKPANHTFNMAVSERHADCGTVGCIGGNMAMVLGVEADRYVSDAIPIIYSLFYPPIQYEYTRITAAESVKAIDNFLRTGKPMWVKVLGAVSKRK